MCWKIGKALLEKAHEKPCEGMESVCWSGEGVLSDEVFVFRLR
jgi:hypothetical protein